MITTYTFTARTGRLNIRRSIIAHCHAQAWRIGLRTLPEGQVNWRVSCKPRSAA